MASKLPRIRRLPQPGKFYINAAAMRDLNNPTRVDIEHGEFIITITTKTDGKTRVVNDHYFTNHAFWRWWGRKNTMDWSLTLYKVMGDKEGQVNGYV